jgi:hypothetical protein
VVGRTQEQVTVEMANFMHSEVIEDLPSVWPGCRQHRTKAMINDANRACATAPAAHRLAGLPRD